MPFPSGHSGPLSLSLPGVDICHQKLPFGLFSMLLQNLISILIEIVSQDNIEHLQIYQKVLEGDGQPISEALKNYISKSAE